MEILETRSFRGLPPDKFGALLARDNLNVPNEETVFESLVSWMSEDPEERSKSLQNLVPHIRAHFLPGPFVDETMKTFLVKNNNSDLCHQLNYENKTPRNGFEQCIVAIQAKDKPEGSADPDKFRGDVFQCLNYLDPKVGITLIVRFLSLPVF